MKQNMKKSKNSLTYKLIKKTNNIKKIIKTTYAQQTKNKLILDILSTVKKYYEGIDNRIHVNAYERAIYQIRKWPHKITSGSEVKHLDSIGKGMVEKIDTIIKTGTLPIIKEKSLKLLTNANTRKKALQNSKTDLHKVLGFGVKFVEELGKRFNITTIAQLKEFIRSNPGVIKLTKQQEIGLKYHDELIIPIHRDEANAIFTMITSNESMQRLIERYDLYMQLAGSYPSGKQSSKDMDILIATPDLKTITQGHLMTEITTTISAILQQNRQNTSTHNFTANSPDKIQRVFRPQGPPLITLSQGSTKFLGLIAVDKGGKQIYRHLDIRLVPYYSYPYAQFYFTGGKVFNKFIREKLKKKGYKLNEWALSYAGDGAIVDMNIEINRHNLESATHEIEKKIFELAGLPYQTIQERY
jgi:DNA polymerase/3'-5' exonuclease PolX